jgi:DNA-3-methyladenine glycosylase I
MSSYCHFIAGLAPQEHLEHRHYHDNLYGFSITNDNELFGRLVLEINQAGLSWTTILKKEQNFRAAYHQFDIKTIAAYTEADEQRLLSDAGIIRNRLKVAAAIHNARVVLALQQEYGSFQQWLMHHHPLPKESWVKLFKSQFRFTGGEIVNEFLMSTGYLPGAHHKDCPVYDRILATQPPWSQTAG